MKRKWKKRPFVAIPNGMKASEVDAWYETKKRGALADFTHTPSQAQPKQLPGRSPEYLAFVRKHPCNNCGWSAGPCEASHHGAHGTGTKASDYDAISLCPTSIGREGCHAYYHRLGVFPIRGGDPYASPMGPLTKNETQSITHRESSRLKTEYLETLDKEGRYS